MKTKLFFATAFILLVQIANAQTFGIKGGLNFANIIYSGDGTTVSNKSITGIHVGLVGDLKLQGNLSFNTGLLYSIKGTKSEGTDGSTTTMNYLEVPLNLAIKFPVNEMSRVFIEAGPYLGYALSGKDKYNGESDDIEFGEKGGAKRFDFGLGFGAGIDLNPIVLGLNYELGLANLIDDSSYKVKNKVFKISLAYMFGKKK